MTLTESITENIWEKLPGPTQSGIVILAWLIIAGFFLFLVFEEGQPSIDNWPVFLFATFFGFLGIFYIAGEYKKNFRR